MSSQVHGETSQGWDSSPRLDGRSPVANQFANLWERKIIVAKKAWLAILFLAAFLFLDGSSTISLHWEGAPPWYLPVGLSMALLMVGGPWSVPLVLLCSVIAAFLNYHRPLFSWCGIPGAIAIYIGYVAAAYALRRWWPVDLVRGTLSDVGRYLLACFAVPSSALCSEL